MGGEGKIWGTLIGAFIIGVIQNGIDVGAKYEIYQLMHQLVDQGKCIIMVSSELPEILGMADRILVMKRGELVSELDNKETLKQEDILSLSI